MERDAERLAWTVLSGAFVVFCLLLVGVPPGIRWYLDHAMSDRPIKLDHLIRGTTLWLPPGGRQEVNATNGLSLSNGARLRTAPDSEALLTLFDGSVVHLWPDTTLRVIRSQSTTFSLSDTALVLAQDRGHARYDVAIPQTASRHFELDTPQASVLLREGSYRVQVTDDGTVVAVTSGSATVGAQEHAVEVLRGEWVTVPPGGLPSKPEPSIHNLLTNGDFSNGLDAWQSGNRGVEDDVPGEVTAKRDEANRSFQYVEFSRTGSEKHAETFIHKTLNEDVTDFDALKLNFQVRILRQTLSGGGILGSEYPIIARIHYRDSTGNEAEWVHGFYIQNDDNHPTPNADPVIPNQWTDESFDLFNSGVVSPRPATILWIEIAASGHGYLSDVARVELLAE